MMSPRLREADRRVVEWLIQRDDISERERSRLIDQIMAMSGNRYQTVVASPKYL